MHNLGREEKKWWNFHQFFSIFGDPSFIFCCLGFYWNNLPKTLAENFLVEHFRPELLRIWSWCQKELLWTYFQSMRGGGGGGGELFFLHLPLPSLPDQMLGVRLAACLGTASPPWWGGSGMWGCQQVQVFVNNHITTWIHNKALFCPQSSSAVYKISFHSFNLEGQHLSAFVLQIFINKRLR